MKRDKALLRSRVEIVQASINDPKNGAKMLKDLAKGLDNTRTYSDTIYALSQIFCVSEKTIIRDIQNDIDL